jgi:lysozyme family protein
MATPCHGSIELEAGMVDLGKLKASNLSRWNSAHILPEWLQILDTVAHNLVTTKQRYQTVEAATKVPWAVIAVIHQRESSQSWSASLAQGDPWVRKSIHAPKDRGPFNSWEEAAIDALVVCPPHASRWTDWSIGGALTLLEQYNGLGYAGRGIPSPYIWSATDQYHRGKYIADGHFDPDAVDRQAGCAALLKCMILLDPSIAE